MEYKSASTQIADGYRAGCAIGSDIRCIEPEVVLIFVTINYHDRMNELLDGIRQEVGENVILCGGTSDGVFERGLIAHHGISALGISSKGIVNWSATIEQGLGENTFNTTRNTVNKAMENLGKAPGFAYVMADGITADGSALTLGVRQALSVPFFGCLAADDRSFSKSFVFLNNDIWEDAVFVLLASTPFQNIINAASGWEPFGEAGEITETDGTKVKSINGRQAEQFMNEQAGKEFGYFDYGVMPVAEYYSGKDGYYSLRTVAGSDHANGELKLFGSVQKGAYVKICAAETDDILDGVKQALEPIKLLNFKPSACVIISCAGRKWLLPGNGSEEIRLVKDILGDIPMIGIASFGEISPYLLNAGHYSPVLFHNVTFVICVMGV